MKSKIIYFLIFFFPMLIMTAQDGGIKGTVISSEDGLPLPGATVTISGTSTSASTDFDGKFSLPEVKSDAVIVVSFIGFAPQTITLNGQKILNISLRVNNNQLNEVVVTGYSKQKKTDITGAVSIVNMKDVMKQPEPNPIKALQGRVAGVKISSDGSPSGSNTKVVIRGVGTLNNTDPLYVIDGMPTKSGMHELNPNDIETIQVLKDASSASIYGSRASNGVIIITTKKGKEGKMRINFSTYTSISDYARKLEVMNANQFGQALWQANINDGLDPNNNNLRYQFDWSVNNNKPQLNKVLVPEYLDANQTMKSSNTDWYDEISQTGIASSYDLSVSNASDKGNYVFSLGYYDNEGVVKTTDFERISARMNGSYKYFDGKLVIGENFSLNRTNEVTDPGVLDPALRALPIIPVHTVDGKGWGGPVGGMNDRQNPVRLLEYNKDNKYDYLRLFGNMYADLEIIKNLHIKSSFGIDYGSYKKRTLQRSYQSGYLQNNQTSVTIDQSVSDKWTWSNTAIYNWKIGKSNLNLMAGTEMYKDVFDNTTLRKNDFLIETPDYMYPDAGTGESFTSGTSTLYSLLSYFGKADYEFDNRYLLSATIRRDGSSRFGKNNQYGTFPAVSAGWRISNEDFIKNNAPVFSDLKLRAGWGQTGNQEISNTAVYSLYLASYAGGSPTWATSFGTAYDIAGNGNGLLPSGFIATQSGNDDLKWETTTQTNIGLDFGLFKQKLSGSVDYYIKKTEDILVLPPYLGVIGEGGNRWVNGASMENEGWEVTLGYRDETSFGLKYDISANVSSNKNKITALPDEVRNNYGGNGGDDNILGRPINSMYGYVTDGLFKSQDEVDNSANQDGKGLGRIRYKDLNGDGTITDKDRTWIGNPNAGLLYGFNLNLSYKNFDFSTFWEGASDVDVINNTKYQTDFWSVDDVGSNKGTRLLNAWSVDNSNSTIPALTTVDRNAESRFSTYYVENGNYLKLRVLQVGYSLPKDVLKKMSIESFRLYISGQNLLIFDAKNFTGVDPENAGFGYPQPTTFTAGLNFTL
ncbi:TonB-linked SusC/RagA family outer membrane protein [Flavobacterium sp. 1]|uniref:SusC/RagA family TonB-linked outer membrane protein n=1 Tax=Flavobacterium sp. 1 TaxID=2035200 RepID=UPI000C23CE2F|nr:TonB-dependent receptor [Flavobacterium sp. 1]PJJ08091.1 TonB-linked SusC/RagA family outer membrane protein [Flavobacterium sp. 1]